jgi:cytochrome c55X
MKSVISFFLVLINMGFAITTALSFATETISAQRSEEIISLLRQDCGACHGMTLQGGLGPSLLPESLQKLSEDQIAATISNGRPGTPMPPWKPFFTEQELHWLAHQLKQGIEDKQP